MSNLRIGRVHLATGLRQFEQGETPAARLELERALWHDDSLEDAYAPLADACLLMGDAQEAERFATRGLELFPGNLDCLEARADARFTLGNLPGTDADADAILKEDEESVSALCAKATVALSGRRPHDAIALLEKAIELEPEDSDILLSLGNAYLVAKNFSQAQARLVAAGELDPLNALIYLSLCSLELMRGDPATGLRYSNVVIVLGGESPSLNALRGQFFLQLERPEDAEEALIEAVAGNPLDAVSMLCLAELEVESPAKAQAASDHARRALELLPRADVELRARAVLARSE